MKLEQLLTEGRDAYLYHITDLRNFFGIIEDDALKNRGPNRGIGISLTRNRRLSTVIGGDEREVRFVLDQRKLSQRYKMRPVVDLPDFDNEEIRGLEDKLREDEELVLTKEITPLGRYLIAIHLIDLRWIDVAEVLENRARNMEQVDQMMEGLSEYARRNNIPMVDDNNESIGDWIARMEEEEAELESEY